MTTWPPWYHFNPRAYVRHDCSRACSVQRRAHFNPRAYVRHDCPQPDTGSRPGHFNPRAYVRHDSRWEADHAWQEKFQSTCLREARPSTRAATATRPHFNPRAYVRHDASALATARSTAFQSTCLREARHRSAHRMKAVTYFNPRAYVRHDSLDGGCVLYLVISIHVPT